jgi:hypothetical protein
MGTYGALSSALADTSDHQLRVRRQRCGAHLTGYNRLRVEVFECGIGLVPYALP